MVEISPSKFLLFMAENFFKLVFSVVWICAQMYLHHSDYISSFFQTLNFSMFLCFQKSFRVTHSSINTNHQSYSDENNIKNEKHGLKCLVHEKHLVFKEVLGNGAFGYVQKAEWSKPDSKEKVCILLRIGCNYNCLSVWMKIFPVRQGIGYLSFT